MQSFDSFQYSFIHIKEGFEYVSIAVNSWVLLLEADRQTDLTIGSVAKEGCVRFNFLVSEFYSFHIRSWCKKEFRHSSYSARGLTATATMMALLNSKRK